MSVANWLLPTLLVGENHCFAVGFSMSFAPYGRSALKFFARRTTNRLRYTRFQR
jgi:hypothetical protein